MNGSSARTMVENAVRRELFGPSDDEEPLGKAIDCSSRTLHFGTIEDSRGQFHDAASKQELLSQVHPLHRYGIGVLHGGATQRGSSVHSETAATSEPDDVDIAWVQGLPDSEEVLDVAPTVVQGTLRHDEPDSDDFDLTDANTFKPSAMAISFKCKVPANSSLRITVHGAYYERIVAHIPGVKRPQDWWLRRPFELDGDLPGTVLLAQKNRLMTMAMASTQPMAAVQPTTQVFSRPVPGDTASDLRLVTIVVVNHTIGSGPSSALFQMGFTVTAENGLTIQSYPEVEQLDGDDEERSIDLLYRNKHTYAIGHGCAAEWDDQNSESSAWVRAEPLPAYEVLSLTPDIYLKRPDGTRKSVTVSMAALAAGTDEGDAQVESILQHYDEWIGCQEGLIPDLLPRFHNAARRHMRLCREALARMRIGWALVGSSQVARQAFQLANEAMQFQQIRSRLPIRPVEAGRDGVLRPVGAHPDATKVPTPGNWRPFQIAFVLANLPELIEPTRDTRSLVDLIFFPTGGGKTEAYLGAAAVSLLARRLRNPQDTGTDTLMRYTLRLLTAQQFLRAASLICVLEDIRSRRADELGNDSFGIGVWLGGTSTPNSWKQALAALGKLRRDPQAQNLFLLLRCPWCGTQMGVKPGARRGGQEIIGYVQVGKRVVFRCIDTQCRYSGRKGMPVHVVDEDIYEVRPSIIIGTVDKFAMMAWRPQVGRLFGLNDVGTREVSPPSLIIQDELHLISGPLGSMVGLYEPVIDELCTDRRHYPPVPPKIIASTATIRRYEDQILGLFGRDKVALFPPHGLEEGHSFFAEPATLADGSPEPGRRYVGILSASLGSLQSVQVRVAAATLQAGADLPAADRDGYWTNVNFLNSLRELGNTVSLLESDVPDYLTGLRRRDGIDPRWPRHTMELTSRRRSDEIPKAIEQLQVRYGETGCVDICLASNIIEVGVDIDRLGLMTIVGQPKTTAQYIQVSGRVGRRPDISPGLVLTIYGAAKPRDRSHYERFRTYHQGLYAQVEPTSLTPFAAPVLRRALHAAAISYIRQLAPSAGPHPFPRSAWDAAISLLRDRAAIVDPSELGDLERIADLRSRQWGSWERTAWEANALGGDPLQGLMRYAGTLPDLNSKATTWDVPTSVRNVDAECQIRISSVYARADAEIQEQELQ
jgi:hypothetical protein